MPLLITDETSLVIESSSDFLFLEGFEGLSFIPFFKIFFSFLFLAAIPGAVPRAGFFAFDL